MSFSQFSPWRAWADRSQLDCIRSPGVYALAVSSANLAGTDFEWTNEIALIGMTTSKGGLRARLRQFDDTLRGKEGHGPAKRFRRKYADYTEVVTQLYVSIYPFDCDVRKLASAELRIMGDVAKFEFECLANFVERFERLPEFNDKARSPKAG